MWRYNHLDFSRGSKLANWPTDNAKHGSLACVGPIESRQLLRWHAVDPRLLVLAFRFELIRAVLTREERCTISTSSQKKYSRPCNL